MRSRTRRRVPGLLPRLGRGLLAFGRWAAHHPHAIVVWAGVGACAWAVWAHGSHAQMFQIAHVEWPAHSSLELREPLIGENLWNVDLQTLADTLHRQQPALKEVRVIRQLPNTLRIHAVERRPIAQVQIGGWHPVDDEGFVLPHTSPAPLEGLIRFSGIEWGRGAGRQDSLQRALRIRELLRPRAAIARRVTDINVTDAQAIRLTIDGEIEVRCGAEAEFALQLQRLEDFLKTMAKQSLAVRYIDVRFAEPVVG